MKATKIKKQSLSPHITLFERGAYEWVNIVDTGTRVLKYLRNDLHIEEDDLFYITTKNPRAKIISRDEYMLVTMRFPYLKKQDNTIHSTHLTLIVSNKRVVTMHHNKLAALRMFEHDFEEKLLAGAPSESFSPANIIALLLSSLYQANLPLVDAISEEIDTLEDKVYKTELAHPDKVKSIFTIDRKVVDFRRVMRSHLWQVDRLIDLLLLMKPKASTRTILDAVKIYPKTIWNSLESHMEAIDSMQQVYESLTSYRLNDIIRILTIISIVFAPMTLISGIFGMNFKIIPFAFHPLGFLYILFLMALISFWAVIYFKKKKWL